MSSCLIAAADFMTCECSL